MSVSRCAGRMSRTSWSSDTRRILAAQGLRAFAYGLGAVLLGSTLEHLGLSSSSVGFVLGAVLAGTVAASLAVGRWADRVGRRRCYLALYVLLAATGAVFAYARSPWVFGVVALGGAASTDVLESGPFTSLEQAMLAGELAGRQRLRGFGVYNAVAAAAGSLGALTAGLPPLARRVWAGAPGDQRWFLVFVPVALAGAAVAASLSPGVEPARRTLASGPPTAPGQPGAPDHAARPGAGLQRSRPVVVRLASLFALDSLGGGFVVQAFVAFWLERRFAASTAVVGVVFFGVGIIQTASFLAAVRIGERFGLLSTMVFTHLPSNALLVALAFSPNLGVAVTLLLLRTALSQMDVPTRQAYLMALVEPGERTPAAAYTNTARYLSRPVGPAIGGVLATVALSAPFVAGGAIKAVYDVILWRWFRRVPLPDQEEA